MEPPAYQCQSCGEPVPLTIDEKLHHIAHKWEPELTEEQVQERHERFKRDRIRVREQREFQKEDVEHGLWEDTVSDSHNIKKTRLKRELTEEEIRLKEAKRRAEDRKPKSQREALREDLEFRLGVYSDVLEIGKGMIEEIKQKNISEREKEREIRAVEDWMSEKGFDVS